MFSKVTKYFPFRQIFYSAINPFNCYSLAKGLLLACKRTRFEVQKDSFCLVKGLVLGCKRTTFENQAFES